MFITSSFPFKFASYKKSIISPKNRATLLTSFSASHYPYLVMLGSMFGDQLTLCKKNQDGNLIVEDMTIECENREMTLENFIRNFKSSDGLDFVIIRVPVFFLITRQKERHVKIYMTTSMNYVEVFSDPDGFFGGYSEENKYYSSPFTMEILLNDPKENIEKDPNEAVVEFEEPVTQIVFESVLQGDSDSRKIRIGWQENNSIRFLNFPLEKTTNSELYKILNGMETSKFEFFEVIGNTKIAGIRREKRIEWYAEIQDSNEDEHLYIKEMNAIFRDFCEEHKEKDGQEE